jgi:hypothetical protein
MFNPSRSPETVSNSILGADAANVKNEFGSFFAADMTEMPSLKPNMLKQVDSPEIGQISIDNVTTIDDVDVGDGDDVDGVGADDVEVDDVEIDDVEVDDV